MFKLAELFVDIRARDDEMKRQMGALKGQMTAMGTAIGVAAGTLAAQAMSSATAALTGFFSRGIKGATDLAETISKVQTVFGDASGGMIAQADAMAKAFGLPKQAILDAASGIGLVGKAAGQSQSQAAAMAQQMAKLAADASSFYNVPLEEALGKIRSGLVGESEPLRAFGVLLTEEAVAAEAVALGLAKSAKEVDQQSKVMARASLITKGLSDASGDLERTAGSTANQWRKLTGNLENMAVSVGETLAPAINELINLGGEMVTGLMAGFESSKDSFKAFADGVVGVTKTIGVVWRNLPETWNIVEIRAREMAGNIVAALATLPENGQIVGQWYLRNFVNFYRDAASAVTTILTHLGENIYKLGDAIRDWMGGKGFHVDFTPLLEGFEAVTEKLPEMVKPAWVSLQAELDAAGARMADKEMARAAAMPAKAAAAMMGKQAISGLTSKTDAFKSETVGVADFSSRLRSSALSGGGDDTQKKQLDIQKRIAENTEKMVKGFDRGMPAVLG